MYREFVLEAIYKAQLPVSGLSKDEEALLFGSATNEKILSPMVHNFSISNAWSDVTKYLQLYPPGPPASLMIEIEFVNESNEQIELNLEYKILIHGLSMIAHA